MIADVLACRRGSPDVPSEGIFYTESADAYLRFTVIMQQVFVRVRQGALYRHRAV